MNWPAQLIGHIRSNMKGRIAVQNLVLYVSMLKALELPSFLTMVMLTYILTSGIGVAILICRPKSQEFEILVHCRHVVPK